MPKSVSYFCRLTVTCGWILVIAVLGACGGSDAVDTAPAVAASADYNDGSSDGATGEPVADGGDDGNEAVGGPGGQAAQATQSADPPATEPPASEAADPADAGNTLTAANLIDMRGPWPLWDGTDSAIRFDATTQQIVIPAPGSERDAVYGVQRYLQRLVPGQEYRLALPLASNGATASLFLYGANGEPLAFTNLTTGESGDSHAASVGAPVRIIAGNDVTGFAVQVQGGWQVQQQAGLQVLFSTPDGDLTSTVRKLDYRPDGYEQLVMADEFDANELDRSTWCTRLAYGGGPPLQVADSQCTEFIGMGVADYANIDENQRFRDFNNDGLALHQLADGVVDLIATRTGLDPYTRFESAALRSKRAFRPDSLTSYYITARVNLPNVLGIWPAFFIIPGLQPNGEAQWPPEVDIFEGAINGGQGENPFTLIQHGQVQGAQTTSGASEWTFAAPGFETAWGYWRSPISLRNRWIEVGMEWTDRGVCYFVDGTRTGCENYRWLTNDGRLANPAEVVMLLAVGGPWAGRNGIDDDAFPTSLKVDHIRVYEKKSATQ